MHRGVFSKELKISLLLSCFKLIPFTNYTVIYIVDVHLCGMTRLEFAILIGMHVPNNSSCDKSFFFISRRGERVPHLDDILMVGS